MTTGTSAITQAQLDEWRKAIGREAIERQMLGRVALHHYARAVGHPSECGQALPPLAHWAFFLPCPADSEIGPDGHPKRGGFLPDIALPRRMFAASDIEFLSPIELECEGELSSKIINITHKFGKSGDLVFAEVERILAQKEIERVKERQTYVYRADGGANKGVVPLPSPALKAPGGEIWQPNEVNLFRFSAATFNSHRIHYDKSYATEVESYPGLVVHGPFTAVKLAALAMREGDLARFSFRAMAPLFLGQPIYLRKAEGAIFEAIRCDGTTAMRAEAEYNG